MQPYLETLFDFIISAGLIIVKTGLLLNQKEVAGGSYITKEEDKEEVRTLPNEERIPRPSK